MGLYQRLEEEILRRVPGVTVKTARTQITFANPRGFAFASFLPVRPAAEALSHREFRTELPEGISPD